MPFRLPRQTREKRAGQTIFLHSAALIAVLLLLFSFNACGGLATPTSASTTPPSTPPNAPPAPAPSLTVSAALPSASEGSTYTGTITATGGTAPYVFSVSSGQLPTGLLLGASTGTISGMPAAAGTFAFSVSVSDSKGLSKQQSLQIAVANNQGNSFFNVQASSGWIPAGQGPPDYDDCNPCGPYITWGIQQGINSPSMDGNATQFNIGGTGPNWDVLFYNHLIGDSSSQGMPDQNHTITPNLHDFTYDVYFYGSNLQLAEALEFDVNQFFDGLSFIWGHNCYIAGGNVWQLWDNINARWVSTNIPCNPVNNQWNHLTIQVERTASNQLWYKTITLNGVSNNVNVYYNPGSAPGWWGITINYQMDGNYQQSPYIVYVDDLTFTYE